MPKHIKVTMPDGSQWSVPADVVAADRAKHYAEKDGTGEEGYRQEYELAMRDNAELLDWAENNMDWDDVAPYARQVDWPGVDYYDGWMNGEKEITED